MKYQPKKVSAADRKELSTILDNYTYTCGASLNDLELPVTLEHVCIRDIQCGEPVEKLYYSMKYDPICIHCCSEEKLQFREGFYPQCGQCTNKNPIAKRT